MINIYITKKQMVALLLGIVLVGVAWAADTKLSALTQDSSPGGDSLIYMVDDPAGTPVSRYSVLEDALNPANFKYAYIKMGTGPFEPVSDLDDIYACTPITPAEAGREVTGLYVMHTIAGTTNATTYELVRRRESGGDWVEADVLSSPISINSGVESGSTTSIDTGSDDLVVGDQLCIKPTGASSTLAQGMMAYATAVRQ